jgi:hypothetical protein
MSGSAAQSRLRTTVSDMWRLTNAEAVAPPGRLLRLDAGYRINAKMLDGGLAKQPGKV